MLGRSGEVKLVDFGIAKALGAIGNENTRTGVVKGKLPYLAPEQIQGREYDQRADLFALGATLYEALVGRPPFRAASPWHLARLHSRALRPPSSANPRVTPALDEVCRRALAIDPAARYSSAQEMARELDRALAATPFGGPELAALMNARFPITPPGSNEPTRTAAPAGRVRAARFIAMGLGMGVGLIGLAVGALVLARRAAPSASPPPLTAAPAQPAPRSVPAGSAPPLAEVQDSPPIAAVPAVATRPPSRHRTRPTRKTSAAPLATTPAPAVHHSLRTGSVVNPFEDLEPR
jgi:serine/threonine-protein kinase